MKPKLLTFLFAIMTSAGTISAEILERIQIGDLYYNLDTEHSTAEVTYYCNSFNNCNKYWDIVTVDIPSFVTHNDQTFSVTSIGDYIFRFCDELISVTIPASITSIGRDAFEYCDKLTAVYVSDIAAWCNINFATEASNPLYEAKNLYLNGELLTHLVIPEGVIKISAYAFRSCNITSLTLPNSLTFIDDGAFSYSDITSIIMPNSVTYIGTGWGTCPNLKNVTLSENITKIPSFAFNRSQKLEKIIIPDKVDTIEAYAFGDCSKLDTIIIGKGIEYIAQKAISWCYNIYVEFTSPTPPNVMMTYSYEAFSGSNPQFYVPCGSISAYKAVISGYSNDHWHEKISILYTIDTSNDSKGYVTITQAPTCETPEVSFYATPLDGYAFKQWSDGNIDNPRVLTLTKDTIVTAQWTSIIILSDTEDPMPTINDAVAVGEACNVTIERTIYRNGHYNTICLPFDIDNVLTSALSDFTVKEFTNATVIDDELLIELSEVNAIEANKPYFIKYNDNTTPLSSITFENVTLNNDGADYVERGDIVLHGTIEPFYMNAQTADNHSYLFLGLGNTLYWPNVSNNIKPFRAYFSFTPAGKLNSPIKKGMPARIIEHENTTTAFKNIQPSKGCSKKIIENGQLYILKNGMKYNMQGQIVK